MMFTYRKFLIHQKYFSIWLIFLSTFYYDRKVNEQTVGVLNANISILKRLKICGLHI